MSVSDVDAIMSIEWTYVLYGILILLVLLFFVDKVKDKLSEILFDKLGITTKKQRERIEDHRQLLDIANRLAKLEEQHNDYVSRSKEFDEKLDENINKLNVTMDKIIDKLEVMDKQICASVTASKVSLGDKINQKYKTYLELNGIPEDEVGEFENIHDAYKGVNGNHSGDAKYEYCKKHLPILPASVKLVYEDER